MSDPVGVQLRYLPRLERLFHILWRQKDALEPLIFVKQHTQIPLFDDDSSQPHKKVLYEYTELSLVAAIKKYEEKTQASHLGKLLPCGEDTILVRDSYKDSYDLLETYLTNPPCEIERGIDAQGNFFREEIFGVRPTTSKALVISGHPGIPSCVAVLGHHRPIIQSQFIRPNPSQSKATTDGGSSRNTTTTVCKLAKFRRNHILTKKALR
jgi:hypothetical protein